MKESDVFRRNSDFILRTVAGETILVPIGKAAETFSGLASLNKSGLFLWRLLEEERTFQELSAALAEEYELTGERSRQDVTDFLQTALTRGIVLQS